MPHPVITASGCYDLPMAEYRGQPADAMSIASSDAVILTESTPAHLKAAWADDSDDSKEADLGTIIHTLILEPHRKASAIEIVDAADWRGKAAQEARDAARAAGKTPILPKHLKQAEGAVAAVKAHPVASMLLAKGAAEQSWFAKDKATGLYLKARTDFFTEDRIILDLKSVASAAPDFLQRRVYDGGWFMQSPWYCDVVERVDGKPAKGYAWIIVEQKPPHSVVIRRPTDTMLMHGHRLNQKAFATFARCVKEDHWPSYSESVEDLSLPTFALYRLEEDGVADDTKKRGYEALAWAAQTGAHPFS
jgi:hypothetical protein